MPIGQRTVASIHPEIGDRNKAVVDICRRLHIDVTGVTAGFRRLHDDGHGALLRRVPTANVRSPTISPVTGTSRPPLLLNALSSSVIWRCLRRSFEIVMGTMRRSPTLEVDDQVEVVPDAAATVAVILSAPTMLATATAVIAFVVTPAAAASVMLMTLVSLSVHRGSGRCCARPARSLAHVPRVTVPDAGWAGAVAIPPAPPIHWDIDEVNCMEVVNASR